MVSLDKDLAKRDIEWCREDIAWSQGQIKSFQKLVKRHWKNKHNGVEKYHSGCELCGLYKEIIGNFIDDIRDAKIRIAQIVRGEK